MKNTMTHEEIKSAFSEIYNSFYLHNRMTGDRTRTDEPTKWGFINGITELAQDFTLDTRYDMENWAGELFTKTAA